MAKKLIKTRGRRPSNLIIFQHNKLIEARYSLTLQEKRLILWLASQIKPNDQDFETHRISVTNLCELLEIDPTGAYSRIRNAIERLKERSVTIQNMDEKSLTFISFIDYGKYWYGDGYVDLKFSSELRPFLINLKKNFTALPLNNLMQFKSIYAIRIYELLKQKQTLGERALKIDDLRKLLGISTKEYKKYNDFKRFVLNISQREINEKSDIWIEFEEIKEGRKVHEIGFRINKNPNFGLSDEEKNRRALLQHLKQERKGRSAFIEEVCELGFSKATVYKFLKQTDEESLRKALAVVNLQISKGQARNPKALFKSALKNGWDT